MPRCLVKVGEFPKVYPSAMLSSTLREARCNWTYSGATYGFQASLASRITPILAACASRQARSDL